MIDISIPISYNITPNSAAESIADLHDFILLSSSFNKLQFTSFSKTLPLHQSFPAHFFDLKKLCFTNSILSIQMLTPLKPIIFCKY